MFDQAVAMGGVAALSALRVRLAGDHLGEQAALLAGDRSLVADQPRTAAAVHAPARTPVLARNMTV